MCYAGDSNCIVIALEQKADCWNFEPQLFFNSLINQIKKNMHTVQLVIGKNVLQIKHNVLITNIHEWNKKKSGTERFPILEKSGQR